MELLKFITMTNENTSIHEFDLNIICEYFSNFERQGPGSPEMTILATKFIDNLTENSKIADVGCGTGGQTMILAQNIPGKITGYDIFPQFIDLFNTNAAKNNLQNRVKGEIGDMMTLSFGKESLDLIWCEGAIYNIGFEKGVQEWHKFLKKGGYIAVTEATWFTNKRPAEIENFWMENYPEIDTISNKVEQMEKAGYIPVATFVLPENCWTTNYHDCEPKVQTMFLEKYKGNKMVEGFIDFQRL